MSGTIDRVIAASQIAVVDRSWYPLFLEELALNYPLIYAEITSTVVTRNAIKNCEREMSGTMILEGGGNEPEPEPKNCSCGCNQLPQNCPNRPK